MSLGLLLQVRRITKRFRLEAGLFSGSSRLVHAVNGIDLDWRRGETYGLVGESGSGKSTLGRLLVQLETHESGTITSFAPDGAEWTISSDDASRLKDYRSRIRYVFQDPSSSLDPRMDVRGLLTAGARYQPGYPGARATLERARGVLEEVGLRNDDLDRRPGEFSGGQRQRLALARALMVYPEALICDEVVSALDVSVQGQILGLLLDLRRKLNLSLLFISHDLTVVSYLADRVGVLYGGRIMEEASAEALIQRPLHPYTQLLYRSSLGKQAHEEAEGFQKKSESAGLPFNPLDEPTGCPFAGRCPLTTERCRTETPEPREINPGHRAACHYL